MHHFIKFLILENLKIQFAIFNGKKFLIAEYQISNFLGQNLLSGLILKFFSYSR